MAKGSLHGSLGQLLCASGLALAATMGAASADGVLNGETVRILAIGDPAFQAMQRIHDQLEAEAGGKIELRVVDFDALHQQTLLNFQNPASAYDIVAVEASQYGEYKAGLLDLAPLIAESGFDGSDFQESAWVGTQFGEAQYGIPIQPHSEILAYRKDLFEAAGIAPPTNTEELLAAAKQLHGSQSGLAGICWNGARGTPLGQTFIFSMADHGQAPIDLTRTDAGFDIQDIQPENMHPMVNSPAGLAAAEFINELMKYSPPGILNMAWDERNRVFNEGNCAMLYVWSALTATWDLDEASPIHGKVGYVPKPPAPGNKPASSLGGWFLSIPGNIEPDRIPLAWATIQWLTTKEMLTTLTENGDCVAPRHSVAADPEVVARCPAILAMDEFSKMGVFNGWERPPIAELQQIVDTVGTEMHRMTSGQISPQEAVDNAQATLDDLMRQAGYY